jgi:DNA-binding NarL/FixJ family response regulator
VSHRISVVIVDRHYLVSEGLARILSAENDISVAAILNNPADAVQFVAKDSPHVIVLDATLTDIENITHQLATIHAPVRVLILAPECHTQQALNLLTAGATSYLCKQATSQDLVAAVRHTCRQEMVLDPAVARSVVEQLTHSSGGTGGGEDAHRELLTDREMEVLQLLCQGITDKEIAEKLCISIRTVNGHLRHIYAKLGVHSRTETMHLALEKGWVTLMITAAFLVATVT